MNLKDRITDDMKAAMRAKDSQRLLAIRMLLAAVKQREVDERIVLDDAQVVGIVDKLIKQRKDSVAAFAQAGRTDLVDKESAEIRVLEAYLPQRLDAAHCELDWSFEFDRDINLSVVQWSALTRMLRELINNVIVHAHATRASVSAHYQRGRFTLTVSDDGAGRRPETWAHGLGLGGIRKRVKLLGGEVHWRENGTRGIRCEIRVPDLGERA